MIINELKKSKEAEIEMDKGFTFLREYMVQYPEYKFFIHNFYKTTH